jgi:hypothetical protein
MFEIGKFDRHRHRPTARDLPGVDEFDLQRDGPAPEAFALTVSPYFGHQRLEFSERCLEIDYVGCERVLGTDRFAWPVRVDRAFVDGACDLIVPEPRFSKMLLQEGKGPFPLDQRWSQCRAPLSSRLSQDRFHEIS